LDACGDEDDDDRLDGLAVVGGGVGEVVGEGEEGDDEEVGKGADALTSPEREEAAEHEDGEGRCLEEVGDGGGLVPKELGGEAPEAGPKSERAATRGGDEVEGMVLDVEKRERVFFGEEGGLAEGEEAVHLGWVAGGVGPSGVGLGGVAVVAGVELEPEAVADRAKDVQDAEVADGPGRDDGEESEGGDETVAEPGAVSLPEVACGEGEQKKKDEGDRGVGQQREAGEQAEGEPWPEADAGSEAEGYGEAGGEEEGSEGVVPDAVGGEVDAEGIEDPDPAGEVCGASVQGALSAEYRWGCR